MNLVCCCSEQQLCPGRHVLTKLPLPDSFLIKRLMSGSKGFNLHMALPLTFPLQLNQSGLVISASPSPRCQALFYVKLVFFLRFLKGGGLDITTCILNC